MKPSVQIHLHGVPPGSIAAAPMPVRRFANGRFDGLESPHLVSTRPQDWAEPARSILFPRRRRA